MTRPTSGRHFTEPILLDPAAGRMVLAVFAGIAEFERELIQERTRSGREQPMRVACVSAGQRRGLGDGRLVHRSKFAGFPLTQGWR